MRKIASSSEKNVILMVIIVSLFFEEAEDEFPSFRRFASTHVFRLALACTIYTLRSWTIQTVYGISIFIVPWLLLGPNFAQLRGVCKENI